MRQLFERLNPENVVIAVAQIIPGVIAAALVLAAFYGLFRVTRMALAGVLHRAHLHQAIVDLLVDKIYRTTLFAFALVMAADQLGINVAAALAGLGVVGLAVGFAAQDSLSNIIAGFLILLDKPFEVDQWVTIGDHYGKVSNITLRSTRIRTPQNTYVVIPNKTIIDTVLVNHSHHGSTRVDVPIGIAYKEDIQRARDVVLAALREVNGVADTPAPEVVVTELAASGVNMEVRVWIDDAATERPVYVRVMEASKLALDAAGIEIPYHHLQLFIEKVEDRVWEKAMGMLGAPGGRSAQPGGVS